MCAPLLMATTALLSWEACCCDAPSELVHAAVLGRGPGRAGGSWQGHGSAAHVGTRPLAGSAPSSPVGTSSTSAPACSLQPATGANFAKTNWLKAGILACDKLLTVSPNYATEIASGPA